MARERDVPGDSDLSNELTEGTPPGRDSASGPGRPVIQPGVTLSHFEVLQLLGAGGFGEVYRARDTRLGRVVAIKVLPEDFARDAERLERFRREAMAASALNHPNICTVHDLVEAGGRHLIVMELVEGRTLHEALAAGPFPPEAAVAVARQIAGALAEVHAAGILHRDIKASNIVLTPRGQVKILDFGIAKRLADEAGAKGNLTRDGAILGTLTSMPPEQLLGMKVDERSDLFSLGVLLYEMVSARLPFRGSTSGGVVDAILHAAPEGLDAVPAPRRLKAAILRLLEKDPARRFGSAEELRKELEAIEAGFAPVPRTGPSRRVALLLVLLGLGAAMLAAWMWHRASRQRWALGTAVPEIRRLLATDEFTRAAALVRQARAVLPNDPTLAKLWTDATMEASVESRPEGADVSYRPYRGDPTLWVSLGRTPLGKTRVPKAYDVWKVSKPGYVPALVIMPTWTIVHAFPISLAFRLDREGSVPPGMVRVTGGMIDLPIPGLDELSRIPLDDYLIDRHEVTNAEYQTFVDAGGYEKREFWKQPFTRAGGVVPFERAMTACRDTTGRPGPATWELGRFPKGLEKHPVAGVSWYEAAAYAAFAGKSLPTIYHWNHAAQTPASLLIAPGSNFQGAGTVPVGGEGSLSGFGTTDMAGNVKEWCANETAGGKRFILGGGFGEPTYMFIDQDAQSPWDRRSNFGFRCVKLGAPPPAAAASSIAVEVRDFAREKPVSDEVFRAYEGLYAYDKAPLNARIEETVPTEDGTRQKVSFDAAYGGERVTAYLYLPKSASPPYQTILYFPGSGAMHSDKFTLSPYAEFVQKSGRALLAPVFKSTFERRDDLKSDVPSRTATWRDHNVFWSKDLGRSIDYLETRDDIDRGRLAYLGLSWGSAVAPILLAVEGRFRAAVLESGGLYFQPALPEAETINFVPRVKLPVLMLNGRYDHFFPVQSSQEPLFRLLGTAEKDKRHVIYETGHAPPRKEFISETLDWLDRYLGPVKR